jgi:methanogenic corrinoid protein MtbC1
MPEDLRTAAEDPLYNIGVVARMTGVPVATLRVWVKARVAEGMQTHQAVRALDHLQREGRAPETPTLLAPPARAPEDPTLARFADRLFQALVTHDTGQADQMLGELLALYPLDTLIVDVLLPAWRSVGEAYEAGQISVATEHLASQYLRHRLLVWLPVGPSEHAVRPTVLACAPGDWHEGGLLILGVMLRRHRWPVAYLGQALPLADLATFVRDIRPPVVVVTAMTVEAAAALADWPKHLPEAAATGRPLFCYAGRAFAEHPELRGRVSGLYLGDTLEAGLATLEQRLRETTGVA